MESSSKHSASSSNALNRRRAGLVAAHEARGSSRRSNSGASSSNTSRPLVSQALSTRAVSLIERYGGPTQPVRTESDLSRSRTSTAASSVASTAMDQPSIPSMDQKIQTLMNLEGRDALHSSLLSSPLLPYREPSNSNLCPSGHSRETVLLEDQENPTTIPAADLKAQTLLSLEGRKALHSSLLSSPLQPFREPSNPNLCPSGHSRSTVPLEDQENPTTIPSADQKAQTLNNSHMESIQSHSFPLIPTRSPSNPNLMSSNHSAASASISAAVSLSRQSMPSLTTIPTSTMDEEDDDILSEEETETTYYQDITIKYPLLSPLASSKSHASWTSATEETNTVALESDTDVDDEVSELKRYWTDLGERINAMEQEQCHQGRPTTDIEGSLAALLKRIEAIESHQAEQKSIASCSSRMADKNPLQAPHPSEKSKSKSRSASSTKTTSSHRSKKSIRSSAGERSSKSRRSSDPTSRRRSHSVDAGQRRRSSRRSEPSTMTRQSSSRRCESVTRQSSRSSVVTRQSSRSSEKPTRVKRSSRTTDGSSSRSSSRMGDSSGSSKSRLMQDGSGSSKARHHHGHSSNSMLLQDASASSLRSKMGDSSAGSHHSSRRGSINDGSGCSTGTSSRRPRLVPKDSLTLSPGKRLSSRRLKSRNKLVQVDGSRSDNDAMRSSKKRLDDALVKGSKSPSKSPSSVVSSSSKLSSNGKLRRTSTTKPPTTTRPRRLTQSSRSLSVPHFGSGGAPVVASDLDTMDVNWWRYQQEQQSVASGSSMPAMSSKFRSRAGKSLVF